MKSKLFLTVAALMVLVIMFSGTALASPASLSGDEEGTAALVELSKPEENFSTFSDLCHFSGTAEPGVKVTVYIKKSNGYTYEKLMMNEKEVAWEVGRSGYFLKEVELERDKVNRVLIYAEKDGHFQVIKRQITVKKLTLKELLKNGIVKIEDLVSKIIKN